MSASFCKSALFTVLAPLPRSTQTHCTDSPRTAASRRPGAYGRCHTQQVLRGTIRDHVTGRRRPMLRFFASEQHLSHEPPDGPLPDAVAFSCRTSHSLVLLSCFQGGGILPP